MGVNLAWPSLPPASHPRVDHLLLPQNLKVLLLFHTTMIWEATVPWGSFNLSSPQNFPGQNHLGIFPVIRCHPYYHFFYVTPLNQVTSVNFAIVPGNSIYKTMALPVLDFPNTH